MICDGKRRKKNERGCCFFFCPSASASLYCRTIVRPSSRCFLCSKNCAAVYRSSYSSFLFRTIVKGEGKEEVG